MKVSIDVRGADAQLIRDAAAQFGLSPTKWAKSVLIGTAQARVQFPEMSKQMLRASDRLQDDMPEFAKWLRSFAGAKPIRIIVEEDS